VIEELAGGIFRNLRKTDEIESDRIINSLNPKNNRDAIKGAGESQGKSGSFFFSSQDKKFIIKTMSGGELKTFKQLFKHYNEYLTFENPKSFLARIYGIFTVKMEEIVPIHLILMGNTIQCVTKNNPKTPNKSIKRVFDLKGSLHGRHTGEKKSHNMTNMKDLNILESDYKDVIFFRIVGYI
jgi:1-phosphatidylinositol-4-phosphate 5-kinase